MSRLPAPAILRSIGVGLLLAFSLGACPSRSPVPNADRVIDGGTGDTARVAPKIILLIGDGMGRGQLEAASIYKSGAPQELEMYGLPVHGAITTSSPSGTTDSAAAATAMATGEFTLNGRVGVDLDEMPVQNLVELAKDYGMATGIVTTTMVSHATPASFVAHVKNRSQYQEIAAQMAELRPDVILGGGRAEFEVRGDQRNLIEELQATGYHFVDNGSALSSANPEDTPYLLGLFANTHIPYVIDRKPEDDVPSLSDMTLAALDRLDSDPDGFFLMVEGGRIDHAGHGNDLARCIPETLAFDDTVALVRQWVAQRPDITILVTSDHETGGLEVVENLGAEVLPRVSWRWGAHTNTTIEFFAQGPGSAFFDNVVRDHRWVHSVLSTRIRGESRTPVPHVLPNGNLEDLIGPSVGASGDNPEDQSTRLTRMMLGADERGIGIGLEGLFRWDEGAVVVLIDVDYGLATGLRSLSSLSDEEGAVDTLLSSLDVPIPADNGFGADLAFVSIHGLEPKFEQTLDRAGLRGLRPPYGEANALGTLRVASNFADNARSYGDVELVESNRGLEAFIRWQELYPGRSSPPENTEIAVWAFQVHEDGSVTNQSLPAWLNPAATLAPKPLILTP